MSDLLLPRSQDRAPQLSLLSCLRSGSASASPTKLGVGGGVDMLPVDSPHSALCQEHVCGYLLSAGQATSDCISGSVLLTLSCPQKNVLGVCPFS